ncbi:hypothetical protein ACFY2R_05395 [Micromonospora olivasterospora]|uniref:Uncharacterized protein n=1 Tax=Micromonospora olivasterospora TaxID=1880 RepID=A0A562I921_MICOL|nr:hypothetical protein [Micromonospora olivasterospora]TWH67278.1 hypothetical protein JD77_02250 [Micromonospora olivasterospora]
MTDTPAATADQGVVLDPDEAADLARLLDLIEDCLLHADDDVRADLAGFLDGSGHGHLAAAGLAALVGHNATTLHRRLRKATTR